MLDSLWNELKTHTKKNHVHFVRRSTQPCFCPLCSHLPSTTDPRESPTSLKAENASHSLVSVLTPVYAITSAEEVPPLSQIEVERSLGWEHWENVQPFDFTHCP